MNCNKRFITMLPERLTFLCFLLVLFIGVGFGSLPASAGYYAYVANNNSNDVSVIDTATNTVVATIALSLDEVGQPMGVAVSPDGTHVYVAKHRHYTEDPGPNKVSVINTATNTEVASLIVESGAFDVTFTPDGTRAYVTNYWSSTVSVIDTTTNTPTVDSTSIPVGGTPCIVVITPDGTHAYVTNRGSNNVSVIDTTTNTVIATIPIEPTYRTGPIGAAITPDGTRVYVANARDYTLSVIDTSYNIVSKYISSGGHGPNCVAIATTPVGIMAYVTNWESNNVSVINTATDTVVATIPTGDYSGGVAITPDGTMAYVTNYSSNDVLVINTETYAVIATIPVGTNPRFVAISPVPYNIPPVANAGNDQPVHVGQLASLDGSNSYDPDENYPLTYAWEIISTPEGSLAELSDPSAIQPTFIADMFGDYVVQLAVTDSLESSSLPDEVLVSTFNTPPVVAAGDDQAIIVVGSTVNLNGEQSYDDDGDPITFEWSFISKPEGSLAELDDPALSTPSFIADVHGDYVVQLIVRDPWAASEADTVIISFENVKPVAVAGENQSVIQGDTVLLDGNGSYDANLDPLTYNWSMVTKSAGSDAEIVDPTAMQTSYVTDLPGEYIVSLVVHDGFVDSDPSNVTAMAISYQDATTDTLQNTTNTINTLDNLSLKNTNMKNALTNKINAVLGDIDQGNYSDALDKLQNDILGKTNGCAETGEPDNNDWIKDCPAQNEVYPLVIEAIELLSNLVD